MLAANDRDPESYSGRGAPPVGGRVARASPERASPPRVVGKEARDFPGCCELESDCDLGTRFPANRRLANTVSSCWSSPRPVLRRQRCIPVPVQQRARALCLWVRTPEDPSGGRHSGMRRPVSPVPLRALPFPAVQPALAERAGDSVT